MVLSIKHHFFEFVGILSFLRYIFPSSQLNLQDIVVFHMFHVLSFQSLDLFL